MNDKLIKELILLSARITRAGIRSAGLTAANDQRKACGQSMAYHEEAFLSIIDEEKISDDDIQQMLAEPESEVPKFKPNQVSVFDVVREAVDMLHFYEGNSQLVSDLTVIRDKINWRLSGNPEWSDIGATIIREGV